MMLRLPGAVPCSDAQDTMDAMLDPQRYVRQADMALLYGSRDEAIALIAQAYLAFDLLAVRCG